MHDTLAEQMMALALSLARRGLCTTHPNPRVGCVLAHGEKVVGQGWHRRAGSPHAEIHALRMAAGNAQGATAYVTLEPCAHHGRTGPCTDALIAAGVTRVIAAQLDPNPIVAGAGLQRLRDAGVDVVVGVLEPAALDLNRGYWLRHTQTRPWVVLKLAASLDGRTALANGQSRWITGPEARLDGHRLRSQSSAILTGIGTVMADNPQLNVRLPADDDYARSSDTGDPPVVVADSHLRIGTNVALLRTGAPVWVATTADAPPEARDALHQAGVKLLTIAEDRGRLDLRALLSVLAQRGCNQLLVECGPTLAGALITADLVDELVIYVAPLLIGADAQPMLALSGIENIDAVRRWHLNDVQRCGADLRLTLRQVT